VAPPAIQRATFQENSLPDSGTVMNGEMFDIENDALHLWLKVNGNKLKVEYGILIDQL
jgi:hypothetical protein